MPILDGKLVEAWKIDPAKHRYVGMWRSPFAPPNVAAYVACTCGSMLQNSQMYREHYQAGHFDQPQYRTITSDKEASER